MYSRKIYATGPSHGSTLDVRSKYLVVTHRRPAGARPASIRLGIVVRTELLEPTVFSVR